MCHAPWRREAGACEGEEEGTRAASRQTAIHVRSRSVGLMGGAHFGSLRDYDTLRIPYPLPQLDIAPPRALNSPNRPQCACEAAEERSRREHERHLSRAVAWQLSLAGALPLGSLHSPHIRLRPPVTPRARAVSAVACVAVGGPCRGQNVDRKMSCRVM